MIIIFKFEQSRGNISLAYESIVNLNEDLVQYQDASKAIVAIFHYLVSCFCQERCRERERE